MSESVDPLETTHISTIPAEPSSDGRLLARFQRYWRRTIRPLRIQGQQTQDIQSDRSVVVEEGAVLAGSIIAPYVSVSGLVYGYLVAREVEVKDTGQVWGDVYTPVLTIEQGALVHGWSSTPDTATLIALANGTIPPPQNRPELPPGLLPAGAEREADIPTATARLILLQHLQAEAGAAIVSRAELERTFEQRVNEVAGDAFTRLKIIQAELEITRQELAGTQAQLIDRQQTLDERDQQIARQKNHLAENQSRLAEQAASVLALQVLLGQKSGDLEKLRAANNVLEERWQDAILRIDVYSNRVENLEGALQASLQRAAEQEEALLRWQELAEVTQMRVKELQTELENQQYQAKEGERVIDHLRDQRKRAQEALEVANEELARLQAARPKEGEKAKRAAVLAAELALVAQKLAEKEAAANQLQEELLWQKATVKSTNDNLERMQQAVAGREQTIGELQEQVAGQTALAENWKGTVGKLSELLYAAEQRTGEAEARLAAQENADRNEYESLRNQLRRQKLQLEAMEKEINYFDQELHSQGQRLAQATAELAEKHLALDQAQARLAESNQERERIKVAATRHIKTLEADLAKTQRQLNDLLAWAERRR